MTISKSQARAMRLLGMPGVDSYDAAAEVLGNAGYRKDAIPQGHTWRTAAKLSDADLLANLKYDYFEPRTGHYATEYER